MSLEEMMQQSLIMWLIVFHSCRHTVMVANSKSDAYTKLNYQGRPVMDKLAEDMLRDVLKFE
jgi:hypothetical protein